MLFGGLAWTALFFLVTLTVQLLRRRLAAQSSSANGPIGDSSEPINHHPGANSMTRQKRILMAAAIAIALSLLFPPFYFRGGGGITINLGYGFLLNPPLYRGDYAGSVNLPLLLLEWVAIAAVSGLLWLILRAK
jgi:hypothetical protein